MFNEITIQKVNGIIYTRKQLKDTKYVKLANKQK